MLRRGRRLLLSLLRGRKMGRDEEEGEGLRVGRRAEGRRRWWDDACGGVDARKPDGGPQGARGAVCMRAVPGRGCYALGFGVHSLRGRGRIRMALAWHWRLSDSLPPSLLPLSRAQPPPPPNASISRSPSPPSTTSTSFTPAPSAPNSTPPTPAHRPPPTHRPSRPPRPRLQVACPTSFSHTQSRCAPRCARAGSCFRADNSPSVIAAAVAGFVAGIPRLTGLNRTGWREPLHRHVRRASGRGKRVSARLGVS